MERLNWILIFLCLGNILLWNYPESEEPKEKPERLKEEIEALEKETAALGETAEWMKRARMVLDIGPAENTQSFINRIQALAKVWKFTIQETAQTGESPVSISLSGVGGYKGIGQFLEEMGKNPNIIIGKLSLIVQDDLLINTHMEMIVRNEPWKGNNPGKDRIEPLSDKNQPFHLGKNNLFGHEITTEKPIVGQPKIRYLGFYSGKGQVTGIIEENLKSLLVQPGDRTPTGLQIEAITPDFLELRENRERGRGWKIPLEKSH